MSIKHFNKNVTLVRKGNFMMWPTFYVEFLVRVIGLLFSASVM